MKHARWFRDASGRGITITTSKRGRPIIKIEGRRFFKKRVLGLKAHWKCSSHHHLGCRAVLHTLDDNMTIIKCYNVHNH
ncbi:Modifier of mdg4 [Operophtera brumata]|uniref:Modifier of mdg4 n=1 Tax=Operophtera brumata TaxID=104452 RepID=A0A0L7L555_OPEBR|nr:Modifier of mdg4 [Operophtera brumata]